jgi:hypothetical protein
MRCPISSPIGQPPPPLCPPLGLLPVPHRARVRGVSSAHHEEVGGLLAIPAAVVGSLRTRDPTAMHASAIPMRDYSDNNKMWTEVVKIFRSKMFDRDLQIKGPMSTTGPLANMSRFFAETRSLPEEGPSPVCGGGPLCTRRLRSRRRAPSGGI